jgi:hypothetical protein
MIAGLAVIWFSWSLNAPITESLTRLVSGAERVLTVVDTGLTRLEGGLDTALTAVTTIEETARSAGQTIVDTNLAFAVLDRTVGDTLFPRLTAARETITTLAETLVAFNETLEAANRLPFVELPTLTDELQTAATTLESARQRAAEIQAELRDIKEEKVARPVAFITDRTTPLAQDLGTAQANIGQTRARIGERLATLVVIRDRLPRAIDLISLAISLIALWLIAAQASSSSTPGNI